MKPWWELKRNKLGDRVQCFASRPAHWFPTVTNYCLLAKGHRGPHRDIDEFWSKTAMKKYDRRDR